MRIFAFTAQSPLIFHHILLSPFEWLRIVPNGSRLIGLRFIDAQGSNDG